MILEHLDHADVRWARRVLAWSKRRVGLRPPTEGLQRSLLRALLRSVSIVGWQITCRT
ncbi:hypothetical protein MPLSOD_270029 [Mesorhizobium sp. SOD10]|nr:hypothetical protein MPLSOD_270029 [Mesorhizobium sp. SOD10]